MKILELTRSFYPSVGGLEKFVADRFKIYQQLGINYKILSTDFTTEKRDNNYTGEQATFLKQYTPYNITPQIKYFLNDDYDILSVNQFGRYFSDYAINYVSKNKKGKIILTPHFYFHTERYSLIKKLYSKYFLKDILKKIDRMICFTEYEKKYWSEKFYFPLEKIVVIPHFIETQKNTSITDFSYGKFILYLGRHAKNKRIDILLNAFSKLNNLDWKLVLTLDKNELKRCELKYVNENVIFLGYVTDELKLKLLDKCQALVLPSDYEAFGSVLLEASKFRKPILATGLPIIREVLNTKNPIYFENNITSLLKTISHFIKLSSEEKNKWGMDNFHNLKRFQMDTIIEKYAFLFSELII